MDGEAPPEGAALARTVLAWRGGRLAPETRVLPSETAVALVVEGATHGVMMATPADLADFAHGFALSEGIIEAPGGIARLGIRRSRHGISLELWLAPGLADTYRLRRRAMIGPTGCGLCGVESLEAAVPALAPLCSDLTVRPGAIAAAMARLRPAQTLNARTRAVHAAAFVDMVGAEDLVLREDVGRHNALDKLAGALCRAGRGAGRGIVLLSSRVSVEMVQKTVRLGAPILVAVSAPTDLACRVAEQAGLTLIAVARGDEFEIVTHPERVRTGGGA